MCRLILTIIAVLIFVACEDSAIVQEVDLLNGEMSPSEKTGISGDMVEEALFVPCSQSSGNRPGAGSGELAITACRADSTQFFETRDFFMTPLMDGYGSISRSSHEEGCDNTNPGSANFMIGLGGVGIDRGVVKCSEEKDDSSLLSAGVTYQISTFADGEDEEESWFLAHWSDAGATNPDVWAMAKGGIFDSYISCGPSVGCSEVDPDVVLDSLESCYTIEVSIGDNAQIQNSRAYILEGGGGKSSCGQIDWFRPELVSLPRHYQPSSNLEPKLVKVLIDRATSIGYDWEYSTDKEIVSIGIPDAESLLQLNFANNQNVTPPVSYGCNISIDAFGDFEGDTFMIEGWAYGYVGNIEESSCEGDDE